jgi:hypothetical protein
MAPPWDNDRRFSGATRTSREVGGTPVLCRQGSVLVAAFHPELTGDPRVHELFVSMVADGGRAIAGTARHNGNRSNGQGR